MSLNIVVTMAGRSSRFYNAGFHVPKFRIRAHDRSLLEWSLISLTNFLTPTMRTIFVCLKEDNAHDFVMQKSKAIGLTNVHILELEEVTDGQATTAYLSQHLWNPTWPLLIYNIDTYVKPSALKPINIRPGSDGWIPCVQVSGEHWSFVKLGDEGWVIDVAEKRRISKYASVGLYWFSRADRYVNLYEQFYKDPRNLVLGEKYVAPLYRQLLSEDGMVSLIDLEASSVYFLGTPTELSSFTELTKEEIQ